MTLPDALPLDCLLVPLEATDRLTAIDALLDALPLGEAVRAAARAAVLAREDEITTGIGGGVAIPHARVAGIDRPLLALGISAAGLDFRAIDDEPVRLVFLCVADAEQSAAHGRLLVALCGLLNDADRRSRLAACSNAAEARRVLGAVTPVAARA